jgi:hypothetical protein
VNVDFLINVAPIFIAVGWTFIGILLIESDKVHHRVSKTEGKL